MEADKTENKNESEEYFERFLKPLGPDFTDFDISVRTKLFSVFVDFWQCTSKKVTNKVTTSIISMRKQRLEAQLRQKMFGYQNIKTEAAILIYK